ncbi:alkylated DNA repair dioxygenase AlkB [Mucilaginibacter gracilis]|uniref:Alkylated DNA repair dioxygenase AlkB n=1 Tax=Mucilaginibacter gracilis TaxID=423350 RepID=A0A495J1Q9_9SPHI|nr:alpha-ketoglutarate-dependent dioxygenase AlkB [Mucilaginibacter gracilis]RKR82743.1 alkylated DNA repair dioxygenase AlkB [Mucilaginibacter gracilis]
MEQLSFFDTEDNLPQDILEYKPNFFDANESRQIFKTLLEQTPWKQESQYMYGREVKTPRLTAWYGDESSYYKFSGQQFIPLKWTDQLLNIKLKIEPAAGVLFNSVLLNYYRDNNDSVAWHSDDEPELGINPLIASVNFGQTRRFDVRHKANHKQKYSVNLENGSLLLMKGDVQHQWEHQVPKSAKVLKGRINLTFRTII